MAKENDLRGMVTTTSDITLAFLSQELRWLQDVLQFRYAQRFNGPQQYASVDEIPLPSPEEFDCIYTRFLIEEDLGPDERFVLILALSPHFDPSICDVLNVTNPETQLPFSEFGVHRASVGNYFLPSGQTAAYLLYEHDLMGRMQVLRMFETTHAFARYHLLELGNVQSGESLLAGTLVAKQELVDMIVSEKPRLPRFGPEFPAKTIVTNLEWADLVLDGRVFRQLEDILTWLKYSKVLLEDWGMKRMVKPGYRALFFGPPGTGKTLCATLLGKYAGLEVFRIDLSMIVSKYIGETEKNLAKVFDAAERKNWILFFDEADALFGKRTKVSDSHDRYANQEVSYLLQRVEEYEGLVLLATNLRSNLDDAFTRRFQSIVHFPMPRQEERVILWQKAIPSIATLDYDLDLGSIALQYELSGGAIVNAMQYACLQTIKEGSTTISKRILVEAIKREYHKEGKTI